MAESGNAQPKVAGHHGKHGFIQETKGSSDRGEYISAFDQRKPEHWRNTFQKNLLASPVVPLGVGLTVASMIGALWAWQAKRPLLTNYFQRGRVIFQGLTVASLVAGVVISADGTRRGFQRVEPIGATKQE
eukprot:Clim_evm56s191 gene=Clim_evmTU56s191